MFIIIGLLRVFTPYDHYQLIASNAEMYSRKPLLLLLIASIQAQKSNKVHKSKSGCNKLYPTDSEDTNVDISVNGGNIVPLGHNRTYTCTTRVGAQLILWRFEPDSGDAHNVFPRTAAYNRFGISIPLLQAGDTSSTLTITGRHASNNTRIQCAEFTENLDLISSSEILIFQIYGKCRNSRL